MQERRRKIVPVTNDLAQLDEDIKDGLKQSGLSSLLPVQKACLPLMLSGKDVLVQSPTGSGKTLAFLLPILQLMTKGDVSTSTEILACIILVPSRELAQQIAKTLKMLLVGKLERFKVLVSLGGKKISADVNKFEKGGANIVVSTPARFAKMLSASKGLSEKIKLVKIVILDEADKLLSPNFDVPFSDILAKLPKKRQMGLFSATLPADRDELIKFALREPETVTISEAQPSVSGASQLSTPSSLRCHYLITEPQKKFASLLSFIDAHKTQKIMVFFSCSACTDYFGYLSAKMNHERTILTTHSKKRGKREKNFARFCEDKNGQIVLFCTDLMARGLDIPEVDWVVHFDLPRDSSGRTARMGRKGHALIFLLPNEDPYVNFVERHQKVHLEQFQPQSQSQNEYDLVRKNVMALVREDRFCLELGTKAFVSYIQAYMKHDVQMICRLQDLNIGQVANGFGLLRLPKMLELRGLNVSDFERSDINTATIAFKNVERERVRLLNRKKSTEKAEKSKGRKRQSGTEHNNQESQGGVESFRDDFDDILDDYKTIKKRKRGKMSEKAFEEKFLGW